MNQIWKRENPSLAAATLLYARRGYLPIYTKVAPPTPGPQEGGGGIMLLKNRSGVKAPLLFGSGGCPLARKEAPAPKPSAGKIYIPTITSREAQVLEMQERGGSPPLMPGRGGGG